MQNLVKRSLIAGFSAALAALILYGFSVSVELPPGHDSAELIAAAASGGIAHPPGYPLYTMLGHILCQLNLASPILTMNLLAALCGALAVGFLAAALSLFTSSARMGTAAAAIFAVAVTPWRLSVGAEVFSLHLAFVAALLFLAALWRVHEARRLWLGCAALVFGLAGAHHQTIVLLLPPLAAFVWQSRREESKGDKVRRPWGWTWWAPALAALGLAPYLYLPWKAAQHPALNWGNPSTWDGFWWVVLRRGYGGLQLSAQSAVHPDPLYHLGHWCASISLQQFPLLAFILGLAGAVYAWKNQRAQRYLWGGICLIAGPVWLCVGQQPAGEGYVDMLERFYATSYLGFAGLIAWGLAACKERLKTGERGALVAAIVALSLGLGLNYQRASARGYFTVSDTAAAMLQSVPDGALAITCNDLTSGAFMYAAAVEGRRFMHISSGLINSPWYLEQLEQEQAEALRQGGLAELLCAERRRGREVYCEAILPGVNEGFFVPCGLMYRYLAPGEAVPDRTQASIAALLALENAPRRNATTPSYRPFWERLYYERWRGAYGELIEGLPAGSKMRAVAESKASK